MNLQVVKETIYSAEFRKSLEEANQPDWLKNLRESASIEPVSTSPDTAFRGNCPDTKIKPLCTTAGE
jgi:hypothetical protein